MPLIAVASHRSHFGVEGEEDDFRFAPGSPGNARAIERDGKVRRVGIPSEYVVADLSNALGDEYRTDAHFVAYVVRDEHGSPLARQPRLRKVGLPFVLSLGYSVTVEVLVADIDNPAHCPWSEELRAEARALDRKIATAGVYYSKNGRRIVQPLTRPLVVDGSAEVEHVLAAWLRELEALGYHPDPGCQDWTRHFRLPHVRRDGKFARSELVDLSRMVAIDPPAPAALLGKLGRNKPRGTAQLANARPLEESPAAAQLEAAGWLGSRLGANKRAIRCPFGASHSGGRDLDTSTVIFGPTTTWPLGYVHCSHAHCRDRRQAEFWAALPVEVEHEPKRVKPREFVSKSEAATRLVEAFRTAGAELSVVVAGCGTGKTEAAIAVAVERSEREHASPDATGKRAPLHSQTALSVPTTNLAIEVAERARAKGALVRRLFGPLSMRRDDGEPECAIHKNASAFSRGGLSVPWELCEGRGKEPCEHASTCRARSGVEGPKEARIVVGPHKLIARLSAAVGRTGLLVIDEPPEMLTHEVLSGDDLRSCARELEKCFEARYADAMRPALLALAAWIGTGTLDAPTPLAAGLEAVDADLLDIASRATGQATALACVAHAHEPPEEGEPPPTAPPVKREYAFAARKSLAIARAVGEASRVALIVWLGLTNPPGHVLARIEERQGARALVVTLPNRSLLEALRREGPTVIADAGGASNVELYAKVVGHAPRVTEVHAEEGAPVARTHLARRASRSGWFEAGKLVVSGELVRTVEQVREWLAEDASTWLAAVVTFLPVALALRAARGEDVAEAWEKAKQEPSTLAEVKRRLGPVVARFPCPIDIAHFGSLRGLDHWKEHDALVTLGDPWSQVGDARWGSEYMHVLDWEGRLAGATAHELEQAHGRLRLVHRTASARALHVGAVVPGGWEPGEYEVRTDTGAKPRRWTREEARALYHKLGAEGAARQMGCHRAHVYRMI